MGNCFFFISSLESNDMALRNALEAQKRQRAEQEKREKLDWMSKFKIIFLFTFDVLFCLLAAEDNRIKDQVIGSNKKNGGRKFEWLSPSPDDEKKGDDLFSFMSNSKPKNGVPARATKKLDLLFSDDEGDGSFGSITKNKPVCYLFYFIVWFVVTPSFR